MKQLFILLAFLGSASLLTAQTSPKPSSKAAIKKECKKGNQCCSKKNNEKTASAAGSKSTIPKKN